MKTITIKDEVYKKLLRLKREDESFSKLFERLAIPRGIEILREIRGSIEFESKEKILKEIYDKRKERRI